MTDTAPYELDGEGRPVVTVTATSSASADAVWAVVTDPAAPVAFSDELVGAAWLDGDVAPPATGARFRGDNERRDTTWSTTCTVIASEPGRSFAWAVEDPDHPVSTWAWQLAPAPGGGTEVTYVATVGPARSGLTAAIERAPDRAEEFTAKRMGVWRENMEATVAGVCSLAEQG